MPEANAEVFNTNILVKRENDNGDDFFVQLKKWQEMMTSEDIISPYVAWKKSVDFEENLNMDDEDKELMSVCSSLMELFKDKNGTGHQEYKKRSVQAQQTALKQVISRFINGKFVDDKAPEYFLAMEDVFKKLKNKGLIDGGDYCLCSGLRGMVGAALLFSMSGFNVEIPKVDWDANHDVDLLVSKGNRSCSVSVKSEINYVDPDTKESFSVRVDARPSELPQEYYEKYRKHIWVNIPNITTEDAYAFCEKSFKARAISLPQYFMAPLFLAKLRELRVIE